MLQIIVNGLLLGGLYGLVTVGFSLIWGVMKVVNITQASFVMLGAYVSYWLFKGAGVDPFLALPVAMALLFGLGYLIQRFILNRVIRGGLIMTLILTFGIDLILQNLAMFAFSLDYRSVQPAYAGSSITIGGLIFPWIRVMVFVLAVTLAAGLHLFFKYTRPGQAIKATALNLEAAQLAGVKVDQIYALTYGVGAALGGAAGVLMSVVYSFNPQAGSLFLTPMFVITVLGGLGSIPGAILGGIIVGVAEALTARFISPGITQAVSFSLLVLILIVRPQGLLGKQFFGGAH
jgi:branched-chain amino acid transport system permease protein